MDIDEELNSKATFSQSMAESEQTSSQFTEKDDKDSNKLTSCTGEISEETLRSIQEDLDRAKESNSFSSSSSCVIC